MTNLNENLAWVLEYCAECPLDQLETGTIEILSETEEGADYYFDVEITDLFKESAQRIQKLEAEIKKLRGK